LIRVEVERWPDGAWDVAVIDVNHVMSRVSGVRDKDAAIAMALLIASEEYDRLSKSATKS